MSSLSLLHFFHESFYLFFELISERPYLIDFMENYSQFSPALCNFHAVFFIYGLLVIMLLFSPYKHLYIRLILVPF